MTVKVVRHVHFQFDCQHIPMVTRTSQKWTRWASPLGNTVYRTATTETQD